MTEGSNIEDRVRDAIAANVDLMAGPPRVLERALASAGRARSRRRRTRVLAGAAGVTVAAAAVGGVALAVHHSGDGVTITAGATTTTSAPAATSTTSLTASALIDGWNTECGVAPHPTTIDGLRFTIEPPSGPVRPGQSAAARFLVENTTDHKIDVATGVGAWYVTTPAGRLVGTSAGYAVIDIGYALTVPAGRQISPAFPSGSFAANSGSCAGSQFSPPRPTPLPAGSYLLWFSMPVSTADSPGGALLSTPVPFSVAGDAVWDVKVTRAQVIETGRNNAVHPEAATVTAKLVSWQEFRDAGGAAIAGHPNEDPARRVWAVSISGPVHSMCCITSAVPTFRWGVLVIDADTGEGLGLQAGSTDDVAPWFAALPDHSG